MTTHAHDDLMQKLQFTLADRLAKSLSVAGISSQEMAEHLDVSRNTISNWINGRTRPRRAELIVWSIRTGVPMSWIDTGEISYRRPDGPAGGKNIQSKDYEMGEIVDLAAHRAQRHSPVHDGGSAA